MELAIRMYNGLYTLLCFDTCFLAYSYIQAAIQVALNCGINSYLTQIFFASIGILIVEKDLNLSDSPTFPNGAQSVLVVYCFL